jgi:hypothetical protein
MMNRKILSIFYLTVFLFTTLSVPFSFFILAEPLDKSGNANIRTYRERAKTLAEETIDSFDVNPEGGRWDVTKTGNVADEIVDGNLHVETTGTTNSEYLATRGLVESEDEINYRYRAESQTDAAFGEIMYDIGHAREYFEHEKGDAIDFKEGDKEDLVIKNGAEWYIKNNDYLVMTRTALWGYDGWELPGLSIDASKYKYMEYRIAYNDISGNTTRYDLMWIWDSDFARCLDRTRGIVGDWITLRCELATTSYWEGEETELEWRLSVYNPGDSGQPGDQWILDYIKLYEHSYVDDGFNTDWQGINVSNVYRDEDNNFYGIEREPFVALTSLEYFTNEENDTMDFLEDGENSTKENAIDNWAVITPTGYLPLAELNLYNWSESYITFNTSEGRMDFLELQANYDYFTDVEGDALWWQDSAFENFTVNSPSTVLLDDPNGVRLKATAGGIDYMGINKTDMQINASIYEIIFLPFYSANQIIRRIEIRDSEDYLVVNETGTWSVGTWHSPTFNLSDTRTYLPDQVFTKGDNGTLSVEQVIYNGGFEDNTIWTFGGSSTRSVLYAHAGTYSLRFTTEDDYITQDIVDVLTDNIDNITFWLYEDGAFDSFEIDINVTYRDTTSEAVNLTFGSVGSDSWVEYSLTSANFTTGKFIDTISFIRTDSIAAPNYAYIDDITFYGTTNSFSYLDNTTRSIAQVFEVPENEIWNVSALGYPELGMVVPLGGDYFEVEWNGSDVLDWTEDIEGWTAVKGTVAWYQFDFYGLEMNTGAGSTTGSAELSAESLAIDTSSYDNWTMQGYAGSPLDDVTLIADGNQVCFDDTGWGEEAYFTITCDLSLDSDWTGTINQIQINITTQFFSTSIYWDNLTITGLAAVADLNGTIGIVGAIPGLTDPGDFAEIEIGDAWDFNEGDAEGFEVIGAWTNQTVLTETGVLRHEALTTSSQIVFLQTMPSFYTTVYRYLEFRVRSNESTAWLDEIGFDIVGGSTEYCSVGGMEQFPNNVTGFGTTDWITVTIDLTQCQFSGTQIDADYFEFTFSEVDGTVEVGDWIEFDWIYIMSATGLIAGLIPDWTNVMGSTTFQNVGSTYPEFDYESWATDYFLLPEGYYLWFLNYTLPTDRTDVFLYYQYDNTSSGVNETRDLIGTYTSWTLANDTDYFFTLNYTKITLVGQWLDIETTLNITFYSDGFNNNNYILFPGIDSGQTRIELRRDPVVFLTALSFERNNLNINVSDNYENLSISVYSFLTLDELRVYDGDNNLVCTNSTGWAAGTWVTMECQMSGGNWAGIETGIEIEFYRSAGFWDNFGFISPYILVDDVSITGKTIANPGVGEGGIYILNQNIPSYSYDILNIQLKSNETAFFGIGDYYNRSINYVNLTLSNTSLLTYTFNLTTNGTGDWEGLIDNLYFFTNTTGINYSITYISFTSQLASYANFGEFGEWDWHYATNDYGQLTWNDSIDFEEGDLDGLDLMDAGTETVIDSGEGFSYGQYQASGSSTQLRLETNSTVWNGINPDKYVWLVIRARSTSHTIDNLTLYDATETFILTNTTDIPINTWVTYRIDLEYPNQAAFSWSTNPEAGMRFYFGGTSGTWEIDIDFIYIFKGTNPDVYRMDEWSNYGGGDIWVEPLNNTLNFYQTDSSAAVGIDSAAIIAESFTTLLFYARVGNGSPTIYMQDETGSVNYTSEIELNTTWSEYTFNLTDDADWTGLITGIRFKLNSSNTLLQIGAIYILGGEILTDQSFDMGFWDQELETPLMTIAHTFFNGTDFRWEVYMYSDAGSASDTYYISETFPVESVYYRAEIRFSLFESEMEVTMRDDEGSRLFKAEFPGDFIVGDQNPAVFSHGLIPNIYFSTYTVVGGKQDTWIDFIDAPYKEREWRQTEIPTDEDWQTGTYTSSLLTGIIGANNASTYQINVPRLDSVSGTIEHNPLNTTSADFLYSYLTIYSVEKTSGTLNRLIYMYLRTDNNFDTYFALKIGNQTVLSDGGRAGTDGESKVDFTISFNTERAIMDISYRHYYSLTNTSDFVDGHGQLNITEYLESNCYTCTTPDGKWVNPDGAVRSQEFVIELKHTTLGTGIGAGETFSMSFTNFEFIARDIFQDIARGITDVVLGFFGFIVEIFIVLFRFLASIFSVLFNALGALLIAAIDGLASVFNIAMGALGQLLSAAIAALEPILGAIIGAVEALVSWLSDIVDAVVGIAAALLAQIMQWLSSVIEDLIDFFSDVLDSFLDIFLPADVADFIREWAHFDFGQVISVLLALWAIVTGMVVLGWLALTFYIFTLPAFVSDGDPMGYVAGFIHNAFSLRGTTLSILGFNVPLYFPPIAIWIVVTILLGYWGFVTTIVLV